MRVWAAHACLASETSGSLGQCSPEYVRSSLILGVSVRNDVEDIGWMSENWRQS